MIREDEIFEGRELEIFAHGISKGVKFAEGQLQNKLATENDDKDRIVGIFFGEVDVERLDSDSDDFYAGYVAGAEAAYEVYVKKPAYNCPVGSFSSCDRAIPCDRCEFNSGFKKPLSEEYCNGYDEGYTACSIKWSDLIPSRSRDLEECKCGHIEHEDIWEPDYIRAYKRGYNEGFEDGFDDGMGEVLELDEGLLDAVYEVREHIKAIQGYARTEDDEGNELIHRIIMELYGLQGKVTDLAQMLAMDKVYDYWHKRDVLGY